VFTLAHSNKNALLIHNFLQCYNLGTGNGVSVLDLIRNFEAVTKLRIPYKLEERRDGDIIAMYANPSLAREELGWTAKISLEQMCMLA